MRIAKKYTFNGKEYTMVELSKITCICKSSLYDRVRRGWSIEKVIMTKIGNYRQSISAASVNADITCENNKVEEKRKKIGMFAQCAARAHTK